MPYTSRVHANRTCPPRARRGGPPPRSPRSITPPPRQRPQRVRAGASERRGRSGVDLGRAGRRDPSGASATRQRASRAGEQHAGDVRVRVRRAAQRQVRAERRGRRARHPAERGRRRRRRRREQIRRREHEAAAADAGDCGAELAAAGNLRRRESSHAVRRSKSRRRRSFGVKRRAARRKERPAALATSWPDVARRRTSSVTGHVRRAPSVYPPVHPARLPLLPHALRPTRSRRQSGWVTLCSINGRSVGRARLEPAHVARRADCAHARLE